MNEIENKFAVPDTKNVIGGVKHEAMKGKIEYSGTLSSESFKLHLNLNNDLTWKDCIIQNVNTDETMVITLDELQAIHSFLNDIFDKIVV